MHVSATFTEFVTSKLPSFALCSDTLKTARPSSTRLEKTQAIQNQWISYNTKDYINAMTIDCDHADWQGYLNDLIVQGIPNPSMIVTSPTGTAHITWFFAKGIRRNNPRQIRIFKGIYERIRAELLGDPCFKNYLSKNPLHSAYEVIGSDGTTHELSDFLRPLIEWADDDDYILAPLRHIPSQTTSQTDVELATAILPPKGQRLWDISRKLVYASGMTDEIQIDYLIQGVAKSLGSPASIPTMTKMAQRISAWMIDHPEMQNRKTRCVNEGVMLREAIKRDEAMQWLNLDITDKRKLSNLRVATVKIDNTLQKIRTAMVSLLQQGSPINQSSLARKCGVHRSTINRLWDHQLPVAYAPNPLLPSKLSDLKPDEPTLRFLAIRLNDINYKGIDLVTHTSVNDGQIDRLDSPNDLRTDSPNEIDRLDSPIYVKRRLKHMSQAAKYPHTAISRRVTDYMTNNSDDDSPSINNSLYQLPSASSDNTDISLLDRMTRDYPNVMKQNLGKESAVAAVADEGESLMARMMRNHPDLMKQHIKPDKPVDDIDETLMARMMRNHPDLMKQHGIASSSVLSASTIRQQQRNPVTYDHSKIRDDLIRRAKDDPDALRRIARIRGLSYDSTDNGE